MKELYQEFIKNASAELCDMILEREADLVERIKMIDGNIQEIVRELGLETVNQIFDRLCCQLTQESEAMGLCVRARPVIIFNTIFGPLEIESPYLWRKGESSKPLKDTLGLTHQGRSQPLERALSDFGIEESFGQAAKRFEEHYGWSVNKTTINRVTQSVAREAEQFLEDRLEENRGIWPDSAEQNPETERLLTELDGCQIRTGQFFRDDEALRRDIRWREVRIGLVRSMDEDERKYVGRMGSYPAVVDQLVSLSIEQGLSKDTEVIAVADGAKGLREELQKQFPNLRFILDRSHLRDHLYETAEAIGYEGTQRRKWVEQNLELIDSGNVKSALEGMQRHYDSNPVDRLRQLIGYIERFRDAVHYDNFKDEGLPIGSGEVESAHRYLPQKRLKIPGACWLPDSINPMLAFRVIRANDWWHEFWENTHFSRAA